MQKKKFAFPHSNFALQTNLHVLFEINNNNYLIN